MVVPDKVKEFRGSEVRESVVLDIFLPEGNAVNREECPKVVNAASRLYNVFIP